MSLRSILDTVFGSAWHVNHKSILDSLLPATDGTVEANKPITTDANGAVTGFSFASGASQAEINRVALNASRVGIAGGATIAITQALHGDRVVNLDTAAGTIATLPAATGSGMAVEFLLTVVPTSNSHVVKVANASDFMIGVVEGVSDDPATVKGWIAANSGTVGTNSDTVTLNRSTTGGVSKGEWLRFQDVAANTWSVRGMITQTGTEATPFSAAV